MLKSIIKRDGTTESFQPLKLNLWSQWASKHLKDRVDWSDVVMDAVRSCGEVISSQELQKKLIDACVQKKDWAHNLMAGRLYAALSHKELYGDSMPKVQDLQKKLVDKGLMKKLSYSQDELDKIEKIIDHSKDFELAYFQISQIRKKYSIQDRSTNEQFESPQYTFMRMAMALSENENSKNKIKDVENYYKNFSQSVNNAPSPNYINLGTEHNGYASCFPAGTKVDTIFGIKNIEEIVQNDLVIGLTGKFRKVTGITNRLYKGNLVSFRSPIIFNHDTKSTFDHKFLILQDGKKEWVKAENIKTNSYLFHPFKEEIKENIFFWDLVKDQLFDKNYECRDGVIGRINICDNKDEFSKRVNKINNIQIKNNFSFYRLVGYYFAEGHSTIIESKNTGHIGFTFNKDETLYVNEVVKIIKELFNIDSTIIDDSNKDNCLRVIAHSLPLALLFKNVCNKEASNKGDLLNIFSTSNRESIKEILIGYIRGDGCAWKTGYVASSISRNLIILIRDICLKLHIPVSLSYKNRLNHNGYENAKPIYDIRITLQNDSELVKLINKNINKIHNRIYQKPYTFFKEDGAYSKITGLKTYEFEGLVYDFEVEEDHSFTVDGICVHNCCLYTVGDTAKSLAIGDHIAYTMTYMSAGIGSHLNVRSTGDKVRGGAILHQGKLPYFKSLASAVCANIQAGRGGACTSYFNSFDPEVETISMLQNPRSTEDKKNRDIHFAAQFNKLFAKKVAKNEDIFLFNAYNAPDLNEAFFSGDIVLFEQIYNKYEKDEGFLKKYVNARKLLNKIGTQSFEVGTLYYAFMDEINKHTPFKDPIHSSNLCVAPETMLLTKDGEVEIKSLAGQEVEVWNGEQWSLSKVAKTGENQKLLRVNLGMRIIIDATPYHKWYVIDDETDQVVVKTTTELRYNDIIAPYKLPDQNGNPLTATHLKVCTVKDLGRVSDTYCVNEPVKNSAVFNGVLTHNCLEITEPTAPYENMKDLYTEDDPGYIKIINDHPDAKVKELQLKYTQKVKLSNGLFIQAGDLQVGDTAVDPYSGDIFVSSVVDKKVSPEVALCSLGAINVAIEMTDEQYENAAYYALKMVDKCIHLAHYELPHVGYTAKNRLNAAIGIIGLATHLARKNLKYSSKEGKEEIDKVFERHAYFVIKASLKLGKELGNAPWMHKTKWPEGWLPIDTYNRKVDEIVNRPHTYDWETLRAEIIANGGIRNSALIAHMPTESSSKASGAPNGMYPIRSLFLKKKDVSNAIDWCAIDSDIIGDQYELAWNVPYLDMIECYAVAQKWTDQAISADEYADRSVNIEISTDRIIKSFLHMAKYGVKTRYYVNSLTMDQNRDISDNEKGCSSGACTL
jgi:ribonucleotide reductase alpha subunit